MDYLKDPILSSVCVCLYFVNPLITYGIHRRCFSMSLALLFVTHKHSFTITHYMFIKTFKSSKISVKKCVLPLSQPREAQKTLKNTVFFAYF